MLSSTAGKSKKEKENPEEMINERQSKEEPESKIILSEVEEVMLSQKMGKAPGPHKITNECLRVLQKIYYSYLHQYLMIYDIRDCRNPHALESIPHYPYIQKRTKRRHRKL
ncbi:hypothetical protein EVAR_95421_1 [Eumeta japonica]|uniref:Uncharacterized protein n=1 Tax=Eumeta variegata TaxID=151549 RepID=A0A4C1VIV3_EUMVA|nr:hypothetical protein EVAR_95421_1 [Eumeta japonica]